MIHSNIGGGQNVAALYLRLSKEDIDKISRGDDSESIKNQRLLLEEEAKKRGFFICDVYSDDDFSGTSSKRPEFNRLIADAERGLFNVVLCKSQSRFTRDMEVAEKYINRIFPMMGIRFIGLVDHVDTDIKGNKKARQINALINEWYVEDLSENIRAVFRSKMRQGQFLGPYAAYGYKKAEDDKHKLVVDAEAATVVRKIFQYCIEGYGAKKICDKLWEEGIVPPSVYRKQNGGNYKNPQSEKYTLSHCLWGVTTVKKILSNEVYIGTLIQGKERKVSYKSDKVVAVPKEDWIVIQDNHEPIISKEDFYKVQEILRLRRKSSPYDKGQKIYPLAGKVICKDCGSSMLRCGTKGTEANYLRCKLASKTNSEECSGHNIRYSVLEEKVLSEIQMHVDSILEDETTMAELADTVVGKKNPIFEWEKKIKELRREKEKIVLGLKSCYMDKYTGEIDEDLFLRMKIDFNIKGKRIDNELALAENKLLQYRGVAEMRDKGKEIVRRYTSFCELTNEIANDFIEYIEIGEKNAEKEQEVLVHWKF